MVTTARTPDLIINPSLSLYLSTHSLPSSLSYLILLLNLFYVCITENVLKVVTYAQIH
jgi:hypothetical protein